MKKDVEITLHAEANQLWGVGGGVADDYCWLTDDNSGSNPLKPREFESTVYRAKKVTWKGQSEGAENKDFKVSIDRIDHTGGVEIFGENPLVGHGGKVKESVEGSAPSGEDIYKIHFSIIPVNDPHSSGLSFVIDPKLKVDPTD
ncbi:MAG: hypothetical protein DHS20C17_12470 [Cyclobacteriaceae bacterium]|nr:MAG: hypothetical protein DHS20C17_12470 [Cyclobacteriaceae bacterium]